MLACTWQVQLISGIFGTDTPRPTRDGVTGRGWSYCTHLSSNISVGVGSICQIFRQEPGTVKLEPIRQDGWLESSGGLFVFGFSRSIQLERRSVLGPCDLAGAFRQPCGQSCCLPGL